MESVDEIFEKTKAHMEKSINRIEDEISAIRTGKASPALLDSVRVDYYGNGVPLKQVASIAIPDSSLITIQPWEKQLAPEIIKAIQSANIGLNPLNEGGFIRIPLPSLTQERRKELVKRVKEIIEEGKIAIRNIRRQSNEELKKLEKAHEISEDDFYRYEGDIQEMTNKSIDELDKICEVKEKEIVEF
ncbi:ribosome recycling factor [bacterium]|nr:ribosome recycling factor [bacterium]